MKQVLVISIISLALFCLGCVKPVLVEGIAMSPTLKNGDRILLTSDISDLKRGEIISFLYPKDKNKWYLKRVIGLPREKVEIIEGQVFINGQKLDEPYIEENNNLQKENFLGLEVPEEHYYVLGDNRDNSSDSRYWGTVQKDLIKGKYYTTYLQTDKK